MFEVLFLVKGVALKSDTNVLLLKSVTATLEALLLAKCVAGKPATK